MKEMACEERPYERCERFGASNLTDSELLAVLLRTGTRGENALQLADKILHPVFSQKGVLNLPVDVRTADADQRNREGKGYPDFVSGGA